ncbi:DUF4177 domain-containing protein [Ruegeria sp. PrR005]|uniref:DUF4177 domain-containing protein n=1 Tax=Ruegeria sp. PrR005 TaxID=2706882 RepID=A0A6B2NR14_9RHOB|nr:DUF4177 domain-containing protein [Ruegeria sp. PrR005]NDW44774.1 DUF4177 domain-containing protein [Ruegeria sp. PrR005]
MIRYEYKVVPAPARGTKAKGVKTPEGRFSLSVESLLNQMGAEGWEYQRAELLPSEERTGLTGSVTKWRNVLVFRRALAEGAVAPVVEVEAEAESTAKPETPEQEKADDGTPRARPIPGPDAMKEQLRAPAPISSPVKDPPLRVVKSETDED